MFAKWSGETVPFYYYNRLQLIRHHQNSGKLSELSEVLNSQYYLIWGVSGLSREIVQNEAWCRIKWVTN